MVNEFDSLDELWLDAAEAIVEQGHDTGSRDGESREVLGYSARLTVPQANFMFNPVRRAKLWYAAAELLWYLSGESDISMIKEYAPQYERFVSGPADNGKNAHGAYGERLCNHKGMQDQARILKARQFLPEKTFDMSQIQMLAWLLKDKPDTRQAIATLWQAEDLPYAIAGCSNDLPCTLSLQFILRDNHLNCIATMRSNDVWLGLPYDVFCFTMIQQLVAHVLKVEVGWYQHQVGSLHIYHRNWSSFEQAREPGMFATEYLQFSGPHVSGTESIKGALMLEENFRKTGAICIPTLEKIGPLSLLGQMSLWTMLRWCDKHRYEHKHLLRHIHNETVHKLARKQCR